MTCATKLHVLIAAADSVAQTLPLRAELRPYTNPYAPDMLYPSIVLTDLFADEPGHGAGTAYINALGAICDLHEVTLYTDAEGPPSTAFYLSRGFERTQGRRQHQLVRWTAQQD